MIGDVTAALVRTLEADFGPGVVFAAPPGRPGAGSERLTVFLVRVDRDPERTNQAPVFPPPGTDGPDDVLPLHLYYLVSAYAGDGEPSQMTAHALLSRAMRALMSVSPLAVEHLRNGRPAVAPVRVSLASLSLEDLSRVWTMLPAAEALWPSAVYLVTNVDIVSTTRAAAPPVTDVDQRVAQVEAPRGTGT